MTIKEIESNLPSGFHDANLNRIDIDYKKRKIKLELEVDTGNPESQDEDYRENYRAGRLTISGLLFCVIEPPDPRYAYQKTDGLWITSSGPVESSKFSKKLPESLPEGVFIHSFYINDWNAFIYLAATDAHFEWI